MSVSTKTVLVVDDDFDIRDTLTDVLSDEGYVVVTAADGLEALAYLRANPAPSVILLDLMMPRCDGPAFRAEQLRDPRLASIPVVLLSADGRRAARATALHVTDCLAKPVHLSDVLEALEKHTRVSFG